MIKYKSSPDVVLVSVLCLLVDELSVVLNEAEHDDQPQVHVSLSQSKTHMSDTSTVTQPIKTSVWVRFNNLEQHHSSIEHVHHGHHGQEGQTRHQGS